MSDYLKQKKQQSFSRKCHLLLAGSKPSCLCPSRGRGSLASPVFQQRNPSPGLRTKDLQTAAVGPNDPWKS